MVFRTDEIINNDIGLICLYDVENYCIPIVIWIL